MSLQVNVILGGKRILTLKNTKEKYTIDLPNVELRNIVFGNKYLYFHGVLRVTNHTTGHLLEIKYPGIGWSGSKDYRVSGHVYDGKGNVTLNFEGKWDSFGIFKTLENQEVLKVEANELPPESSKYYNMAPSSMDLNNLTKEMLRNLPPTDS